MRMAATYLLLLMFVVSLSGCATANNHLPAEVYQHEPEYSGPLETTKHLAQAYMDNTTSLRRANNKLTIVCIANRRCKAGIKQE